MAQGAALSETREERFKQLRELLFRAEARDKRDVSDDDWHLMVGLGYARRWADATGLNRVAPFNACLEFLRQLRERDAKRGRRAVAQLTEHTTAVVRQGIEKEAGSRVEQEYARALGTLAVQQAGAIVEQFRAAYLEGRTLTPDEARALLDSRLARLYGPAHFAAARIPIVGHRVADTTVHAGRSSSGRVRLAVLGGPRARTLAFDGEHYWSVANSTLVELPGRGLFREPEHVPVLRGSVLHAVGMLGAHLAAMFGWTPAASVWFALTNEPPAEPAAVARFMRSRSGRATITVEALAHVGAKTVARLHEAMRRRTRRPPPKRMRLVAFMVARGAERVTPTLCREFNHSVGVEYRYKDWRKDWRHARRDWMEEAERLGVPVRHRKRRGR